MKRSSAASGKKTSEDALRRNVDGLKRQLSERGRSNCVSRNFVRLNALSRS